MKVLIVVRTLKIGGMERVAVNLADAFAEQGHESHLMYFKPRPPQLEPNNERVNVHHFTMSRAIRTSGVGGIIEVAARLLNSVLRKSYFLLSGWWGGKLFHREIRRLERRYGAFDRIIFRGIGTFETAWSFQDPRACYVLENIVKPTPGHAVWLERLKARCLFHNKHLVTVSQGVEKQAATAMQALKVQPRSLRTITNPCPIEDIRKAMVDDCPELPSSPYLLNVARLVPQKNHHLLLRAYAKMRTTLPLVIVGDGPLRNELEALAIELGIAGNVTFAGRQLNPYPWMHHARLFILSSAHEGLGIVLFEALACQTPVVSVDCPGGVRDIMAGELAAYLCEMTPEALSTRVDAVLDTNGYAIDERWLERFSPAKITSAFLQEMPV
ncbi:glycosyltransferase [Vreelandella massiliensis]|uniref:glycosyltransferase n=1 Tax=Vreelandella massiliensis TaxID=1816686 RepID=UPI00096A31C8|nr:glycosyltransferase [Halomonas massiliensis]